MARKVIDFNTKGLLRFEKSLNKLERKFPNASRAIRIEWAGESQKIAQNVFVPVISGDLRSTIRVIVTPTTIKLVAGGIRGKGRKGAFVDYAVYVNDGTTRIRPSFFMEKSVLSAASKVDSFSRRTLKSWIRNIRS